MIPFEDLLWVIFYAAAAAFVVAGLALGVLYALRGHSVATQLIVVGAATVLATISGILVISFMMLLNDHDRSVVLAVVTSAGLVAMAVSVLLGRRLVAANRVLVEAVRAAGSGGRRPPPRRAGRAVPRAGGRLRPAGRRARARAGPRSEPPRAGRVGEPRPAHPAGRAARDGRGPGGRGRRRPADHQPLPRPHPRRGGAADRDGGRPVRAVPHPRGGAAPVPPPRRPRRPGRRGGRRAEALARAKGVRLHGDVRAGLPVQVDAGELGRALRNLVVNAIRHTPSDGAVEILGEVRGGEARVTVADACGGIPEDDLPRVFDVAFRGEAARTPGGGAARPAIARGIVEAHAGEIGVANEGPGCRFEVRLPDRLRNDGPR